MNPLPAFAATYSDARRKFRSAAAGRGLAVEQHVNPTAIGAEREELSIDVARLGHADAGTLLLLTSGAHGAEGFCGSGCQVGLLEDDDFVAVAKASGIAILLLHALNPHGFSHLRRTNEDNVDLNRNFRDFTKPVAPNSAYAELHPFLVPRTWPPEPANEQQIARFGTTHGMKALQAAITGGQHEHPQGLFYGGVRPAWSNATLRDVLRRHAASCGRLLWIDFHTALGPWGHGEKIFFGPPDAPMLARARSIWGADVTSFHDGTSTSAPLTGVMYQAALDECPEAEYTGIALEYGTVPLPQVFLALRADQWLQGHPQADEATRASIKRQVRDAFHGDADDWKAMVYAQARVAALQVLRAFGKDAAEARTP